MTFNRVSAFFITIGVVAFLCTVWVGFDNLRLAQEIAQRIRTSQTGLGDNERIVGDYMRFKAALLAYAGAHDGVEHDDLLLAFDVLWGRLEAVTQNKNQRDIEMLNESVVIAKGVLEALAAYEERVVALDRADRAEFEAVIALFSAFDEEVFHTDNVVERARNAYAQEIRQDLQLAFVRLDRTSIAFLSVAFCLLFLIGYEAWLAHNAAAQLAARERDARHAAAHDALTGVLNRRFADGPLDALLEEVGAGQTALALLAIDLDGFKAINDRHGHQAGDAVLVRTAARLCEAVRAGDRVVRMGGDEFLVALTTFAERDEVVAIAERLVRILAEPIVHNDAALRVSASVGVAVAEVGDRSSDALMRRADLALYVAKQAGKNQVAVDRSAVGAAVELVAPNGLVAQS